MKIENVIFDFQGNIFFEISKKISHLAAMQFKDVIGQVALKEQLVQLVQHNRLSHAIMFLGREGSGALPLAIAFAQYIMCDKVTGKKTTAAPQNDLFASPSLFGEEPAPAPVPVVEAFNVADSCGNCPACIKAAKFAHPDIHFSYPVVTKKSGDKPISADYIAEWRTFISKELYANSYDWLQFINAENKQGNITSRECEEILKTLSLKSFESGYKILIMWMPEALGKEGNKLLKLIEEPPADTLLILVAENDEQILPTILSRVQLIKVPLLQPADIQKALIDIEKVPAAQATKIAGLSEGNYHEALQQLQNADEDWETYLRDWLNSILKTGPVEQVKWIENIAKAGREKQKQFLRYFLHILELAVQLRTLGIENMSAYKNFGNAEGDSHIDFARRLNRLCAVEQLEAISTELDNATYYIERNANAKMLFHALTIKLYHIFSNKSVILMH